MDFSARKLFYDGMDRVCLSANPFSSLVVCYGHQSHSPCFVLFPFALCCVCNGYSDRQSRNRIILNLWLVRLSSEIAKSLTEVFLD